jgi:co-chaperonin GroES (HSP10)
MKEQSSILKPNNKLVGVKPSKKEEPKLPKPTGWRLLVLPFKMKDWVMFARYAGSRIKIEGGEMRLLNDDEVLATIDSPEDILHEY